MDLIQLQRFHAIKRSKKHQLFNNFFLYSMIIVTCSLFFSSPFWFPSIFSSLRLFPSISIPKISSTLLSAKFIFIFGNLIIILLIGESKFFASNSLPVASDVYYNEYINRKRGFKTSSSLQEKDREKEILLKENASRTFGGKMEVEVWHERKLEVESEKEDLDGEDELSFPTEELNKRADDFIARVNRQRRLEAGLLLG